MEPVRSGYQGTVYVGRRGGQQVIVKKSMGGPLARRLRRAMIRREHRVYRRLVAVPGVPRCYGLHQGRDLVLELVQGASLRDLPGEPENRDVFYTRLLALIEALHEAGVAHADLKRKDNILVGPGGQPYLVDFGAAAVRRPGGGPINRFLFRQACRMDFNAWIKLKYYGRYEDISPGDRPLYQPTAIEGIARVVRRAWRKLTARRWRRRRRR